MKETYYFSHDCNARNDVKILKLRRSLGMKGYGIYWALIEMLREEENHKLQLKYIDEISFSLVVDNEDLNSVIHDFELFVIDDDYFYSDRLIRSMEKYADIKKHKSNAGKKAMNKRWGKKDTNTNTIHV